ncbi:hypothetical protein [Peribacillus loiseleuriae]|uniref:Uncharacterized protein n=1 Tax=Peribacillus loiseleuriae TaxID=1679170 RepID=A0A0K9GUT3_9BACI|nr:hypothetical protein [Peribacillus loiseleuriae]KMY50406.1 hypothetical protein AC625_13590 [Peribacillus loiseleuriae]
MSITKPSLTNIVKKQYSYKLRAYRQVYNSLIALQLLAIFFSFNGVGSMSGNWGGIHLNINYYSADIIIIFTMLWGLNSAALITTKAYRFDDFAFVTNRLSGNMANLYVMLTLSVIGGLTSILSGVLLKLLIYYSTDVQIFNDTRLMSEPNLFVTSILSASMYVFLFCVLGYMIGMLFQVNKMILVALAALFIWGLFKDVSGGSNVMVNVFTFFVSESSLFLFFIKMMFCSILLFSISLVISNRMEVRQ